MGGLNDISGFLPHISGLALLTLATLVGLPAIRKLVKVHEARHELKHGSAGYIRTLAGWGMIALWIMATWYLATILGDWSVTGDLGGAIERSLARLRILLEIAAALGDN